ncbi:MAG: toll/interleukin-1 receptor domain-containing protein [Candidatus Competibacteraceae bacterium]
MKQRTYRYDAFISYARHDGKIDNRVATLVNLLKEKVLMLGASDFNVFLDIEGIPVGEAFNYVILQALKESQILISIITESYLRSKYCQLEFNEFRKFMENDQQRKIIPVLWNDNGIYTCVNTNFYKDLFKLNILSFTEPHPVRKEINKRPIPEEAEKALAILAATIRSILCAPEKNA